VAARRNFRCICDDRQMNVLLPYPPSANRYIRRTARGCYRTAEADRYRATARSLAISGGAYCLAGNVVVVATLMPKSTRKGVASKTRLDIDNCVKVAADALQGVCYEDDSQIVRLTIQIGAALPGGGLLMEITEVNA